MDRNAKVAVTLGDPAGVGPEVIVKALAALPAAERRDFVIVGNAEALERAARATDVSLNFGPSASEDGNTIAVDEVPLGAPSPKSARSARSPATPPFATSPAPSISQCRRRPTSSSRRRSTRKP